MDSSSGIVSVHLHGMLNQLCHLTGMSSREQSEDREKLLFTLSAMEKDPFAIERKLPRDIQEAIEWQACRTPEAVMKEREEIMKVLEAAGKHAMHWHVSRVHVVPYLCW